uniref:Alpha/beta hydrolase n=1 Tax=Streptomyces sp. NBC_01401 TaxID=2903854 RepID=A0AAU3GSM1_9ACTN
MYRPFGPFDLSTFRPGQGERPERHAVHLHGGAWINEITGHHWKLIAHLAAAAVHEAPGMVHVYPLLPIPEGRAARAAMAGLPRS